MVIAFGMLDLGTLFFMFYRVSRMIRDLRGTKRHTYATINGLEDAMAIAIDVVRETEASLLYLEGRAKDLLSTLQEIRQGPHSYADKETSIKRRKVNYSKGRE